MTKEAQAAEQCNIVLDTEALESQGLNFTTRVFERLAELCHGGEVHVFVTSVTEAEIMRHITRRTSEYAKRVRSAIHESRILMNVPDFAAVASKDAASRAAEQLRSAYANFKERCRVEVIHCDAVDVAPILKAYFEAVPPFTADAGKQEFPDAISLRCAEEYFEKAQARAIIVSQDADVGNLISALCVRDRIRNVKTIGAVLDSLVSADRLKAILRALVEQSQDAIGDQLSNEFFELGLLPLQYDAELVGGHLVRVAVKDLSFLQLTEEYGIAEAVVELDAEVSIDHEDPRFTYYDSEDKEAVCLQRTTSTRRIAVERAVEIEFTLTGEAGEWQWAIVLPWARVAFEFDPHDPGVCDGEG